MVPNNGAGGQRVIYPLHRLADGGAVGTDRLNYATFVGFFYVRPPATVGPEPRD
jgi:hypothetical protein